MAWRVRGGELPLSRTLVDPDLHYGQISTTQKDGTPPFLRRNAHSRTLYSAWSLLLDAQSSCVVLLVVLGLVRCLRWKMGTKLGRSQLHVRPHARTVGTSLLSRLDAAETPHLPCLDGQVWFPGATLRAIKRCQKVWRQSWRTARSLIRFGTKCWVDSLGVKWAAMGPCAPSEPVPHSSGVVATSEHAVFSGWSAGSFSPVQSIPRAICVETHGFGGVESVTRATYISMPSKPVFFSSGLAVTNEHAGISVFFC